MSRGWFGDRIPINANKQWRTSTNRLHLGAFQKRGSRSKEQQWQRINEEGVSLRGAQATKQSRSKRLLRFARNDTFSSLGCRHHLGEYLFSGMHPLGEVEIEEMMNDE